MQPRDLQVEKILSSEHNNPTIPSGLPKACLKATFDSSKTYGLFTTYFDAELYHYAADFYENHFYGVHHMYSILGVTRVLEDVEISQRNHPQYQDMKRFLEQDFATIHDNEEKKILSELLSKFSPYLTARVDVRFFPKDEQGDFQILSCSDGRAKIKKPEWLNKDDVSYMITSYIGNLELVAKAMADGKILINLWTLPYYDPEDKSKKMIYWIDYTKLIVNEETVFDTVTPAWHGKAYNYNLNVKANEEVKIQVEWLPHRSDT